MWMRARIDGSRRIDDYCVPGMHGTLLAQIQKDFREEPGVQLGIKLKLDFHKEHRPIRLVVRRLKHAIKAKGSLFEFDRRKLVVMSVVGWLGNQVEQQLRQGLKQVIEERVGFHSYSFSIVYQRAAMWKRSS